MFYRSVTPFKESRAGHRSTALRSLSLFRKSLIHICSLQIEHLLLEHLVLQKWDMSMQCLGHSPDPFFTHLYDVSLLVTLKSTDNSSVSLSPSCFLFFAITPAGPYLISCVRNNLEITMTSCFSVAVFSKAVALFGVG